jgi:hypothetical protein
MRVTDEDIEGAYMLIGQKPVEIFLGRDGALLKAHAAVDRKRKWLVGTYQRSQKRDVSLAQFRADVMLTVAEAREEIA